MSISSWNWCFNGDWVVSTKARLLSICWTNTRIRFRSSRRAFASAWLRGCALCAAEVGELGPASLTGFCWTAAPGIKQHIAKKMMAVFNDMEKLLFIYSFIQNRKQCTDNFANCVFTAEVAKVAEKG
jgi:hypothetical protein